MIGKQLDLFGGAPMPPKIITVEEETEPAVQEVSPLKEQEPLPDADIQESNVEEAPESPHAPVSEIFVQMPGSLNDPLNNISIEDELPESAEPEQDPELQNEKDELLANELFEEEVRNVQTELQDVEDAEMVTDEDSGVKLEKEDVGIEAEETIAVEEELESVSKEDEIANQEEREDLVNIEEPTGELPEEKVEQQNDEEVIALQGEIKKTEVHVEEEEVLPDEAEESEDIQEVADLPGELEIISEAATESGEVIDESQPVVVNPENGLNIPADNALYSRQYYTMRETAAMFNVNQSLLRFWENEFDILKPKKNRKGDRYFRPEDIRNLELIYHLLRVRKFTIEGAKDYLKSKAKSMQTFEMVQRLEKLKLFLHDLKTTL